MFSSVVFKNILKYTVSVSLFLYYSCKRKMCYVFAKKMRLFDFDGGLTDKLQTIERTVVSAPLFSLLALCTGHWPIEKGKKPSKNTYLIIFWLLFVQNVDVDKTYVL